MPDTFVTFKKYPEPFLAKELEAFLLQHNIPCIIKQASSGLDGNFTGELLKDYEVQLAPEDFERAEKLLEDKAAYDLNNIPADYYLLDFTDEELYDVVLKKEEWNEFDYLLARKMLEQRGKPVDNSLLKSLNNRRIADLSKPEENQKGWIIAGYILALLGGIWGIVTGYVLMSSKKTLPNGQRVYSYNEKDRTSGKNIFILGAFMLAFWVAVRILIYL